MPSATIKRLQLGNELRHLRKRAGVDLDEARQIIDRSLPVMSRLERGETGIRQGDLKNLVKVLSSRINDGDIVEDLSWYQELNRGAEQRGRWTGYRAQIPRYFRMAVDLEADASRMNIYVTELPHGLLQCSDFMTALFTEAKVQTADQGTERAIKLRLERQQVLRKPNPPEVRFVLSESCLHRMVGSPKVMQRQMRHLADLALLPNVHIHVAPFTCRVTAAVSFPFVHFTIPAARPTTPPLEFIYVETFTNGEYLDDVKEVTTYSGLWDGLLGAALDPAESREFLIRAADWFK